MLSDDLTYEEPCSGDCFPVHDKLQAGRGPESESIVIVVLTLGLLASRSNRVVMPVSP